MEKQERQQIQLDEMKVTQEGAYLLNQAASWAKFISIMGLISLGLVVCIYLVLAIVGSSVGSIAMSQVPEMAAYGAGAMAVFSWSMFIVILIVCGIAVIPYAYQFNFARRVRKAFEIKDMAMLAQGFRALKNYYVFTGIMLIITLAFMLIGIIIVIATAAIMI